MRPGAQRRRADAERSIAAILDAAVDLLGERPDASMDEIARAAGVSRQTVYAHYSSREALLHAVAERAMAQSVAAIDAADPEHGPPAEALVRLLDASWQTLERHARLFEGIRATSDAEEREMHAPILERLERLIRRGRRAGVFDRTQPIPWMLAAVLSLSHAAAAEVGAGRMKPGEAGDALRRSVLRVFGVGAL